MKHIVLASAMFLTVQGCDLGHSPANIPNSISPGSIRTDLRLFDTTGSGTAEFRSGESFDMQFVLLNKE